MDLSNPVLSGLIRKRQELAADLDAAQATLRRVVASLDAMDATIRLFSPDLDLDAARVRRIHPVRTTAQLVDLRLVDGLRVHALASAATAASRASTSTTLGS